MSTGQARRQIPDLSGKGYCHESLETLARSRPPDGTFNLRESRSAGGKRHGEQAAVDGCIGVIDILYFRINRRRCGGSRILQAICPGGAEPGARRIGQSALRRRPARLPMVVGFCGSLRMVSGSILWRRRHRARRADAIFERLHRPLILAPRASPSRFADTREKGGLAAASFALVMRRFYWQGCRRPSSPLNQVPG